MIDPQLLRDLGWSDALIEEVNRVATEVDAAATAIRAPAVPHFAALTQTSSAFFIAPTARNRIGAD